MKKTVKIVLLIVVAVVLVAVVLVQKSKPQEVQTSEAVKQCMTEQVELKGNVYADGMEVITATKSGIVESMNYKVGDYIAADTVVSEIDDSEYQKQIQDQILVLEEQKKAAALEGKSTIDQAVLQQVQLAGTADAARRQYNMMFQDGGTASNNLNAAEYALEAAKWNYEAAHDANRTAEQTWKKNKEQGIEVGDLTRPYSGSNMASLAYAYSEAKEQLENAKLMNSEQNKEYYQGLIESYENQYYALADSISHVNAAVSANVNVIDANIEVLKSQAQKEEMICRKGGIVADVLVDAGTYVDQFTPVLAVYSMVNGSVEAYMLTEDAAQFQVGDEVDVTLPDKSVTAGKIVKISNMAEEKVSTLGISENRCRVEIEVPDMPSQFGPGYEVTLTFQRTITEESVLVPVSAVMNEEDGTYVYVISEGKAMKSAVTTGIYSGGYVQILSGIDAGCKLVDAPENLKNGAKVTFAN